MRYVEPCLQTTEQSVWYFVAFCRLVALSLRQGENVLTSSSSLGSCDVSTLGFAHKLVICHQIQKYTFLITNFSWVDFWAMFSWCRAINFVEVLSRSVISARNLSQRLWICVLARLCRVSIDFSLLQVASEINELREEVRQTHRNSNGHDESAVY